MTRDLTDHVREKDEAEGPRMRLFVTPNTYHREGCPALQRANRKGEWKWANKQKNFDPIEFGRMAYYQKDRILKKPCLKCFPEVRY